MADLDPAGRDPVVADRRAGDRGEVAVGGVGEARDEARGGAAPARGDVRVGDEELVGVGRAELAAELAVALGRGEALGVDTASPGPVVRSPSSPTVKLSICELAMRVPTSLVPSPLKRTSPGLESFGSAYVEPGIALRCPPALSVKPV